MKILGILFLIAMVLLTGYDYYKSSIPANEWMSIESLYVPDHAPGDNPAIIVDRKVKDDFFGQWSVEVQQIQGVGWVNTCYGSGYSSYEKGEELPKELDWTWWIGKPCVMPEGTYRLVTVWRLKKQGWPDKVLKNTSNIFKVEHDKHNPSFYSRGDDTQSDSLKTWY